MSRGSQGLAFNDEGVRSSEYTARQQAELGSNALLERLRDAYCHHANKAGVSMQRAQDCLVNGHAPFPINGAKHVFIPHSGMSRRQA